MRIAKLILAGSLVTLATDGMAVPIRVGIFKGVGASGRYWHTHIHPGSAAIAAMLANPLSAGIGNPIVPADGFSVTMFGVDTTCAERGCKPTLDQSMAFIAALDTLDVALFPSNVSFAFSIPIGAPRDTLRSFWRRKGVISLHASNDSFGDWASWDSLNAARFQNHPSSEREATLRLDTLGNTDPTWKFLNSGLPDTARFSEEWFSFTTDGNVIRNYPGVKVTVNIDENSYEGGMGGARPMGDHPMSWYHESPDGGRFLYTAIGHNVSTFDSVYFFRRQLYNAILWSGGYEATTAVASRIASTFADRARVSSAGGALIISLLRDELHTVEIRNLKGRLLTTRRNVGKGTHNFPGIRSGLHVVVVKTATSRVTAKILMP